MVGIRDRVTGSASAVVRVGRDRVHAVRGRARSMLDTWKRRRFFARNPSRAADAEVRTRENRFYQVASSVVSDIVRIEFSTEYGYRADTAQDRRDARADAVAARHDAKRAFPQLLRVLDTEIASTSAGEVVAASRVLAESVRQYLRGNTVSEHLHPKDALSELHSVMYDQDGWDLPEDSQDTDAPSSGHPEEATPTSSPDGHTPHPESGGERADEQDTDDRVRRSDTLAASETLLIEAPVTKRAGDPDYRERLLAARYKPHIAPFNRYVDLLREQRGEWLPYVAPTYGGVDARLLSLFQDPGPKTRTGSGSGMLCVENPDDSAARYLRLLTDAGIDVRDTISWNSYPWYIARPPTDSELDEALPVLTRILGMLPQLEVVLLQGGTARKAWERLSLAEPAIIDRLEVIPTYHTSPRVIAHVSPAERDRRERKLSDDFARAKALLTRA